MAHVLCFETTVALWYAAAPYVCILFGHTVLKGVLKGQDKINRFYCLLKDTVK